jgi:hypothetical protein
MEASHFVRLPGNRWFQADKSGLLIPLSPDAAEKMTVGITAFGRLIMEDEFRSLLALDASIPEGDPDSPAN